MHPIALAYHLALVALCVATWRRPAGGLLLVYGLELVPYAVVRVGMSIWAWLRDAVGFLPSHWDHLAEWVGFLAVSLPLPVLAVVQVAIAIPALVRPQRRTAARLRALRRVLAAELVAALAVILIDALRWPREVVRDLNLVLWPACWGLYLLTSRRVRRLFAATAAQALASDPGA